MRIATAGVRTGFAMTPFQEVRWVSLWCVGEGLSCPPLCRPTDGHCRARQSGHFLETGSLHPPLAALRRFPLPRATARVAPTEVRQESACEESPSHGFAVPVSFRQGAKGTGDADCHGQFANWPRNDRFLQEVRWAGRWGQRSLRDYFGFIYIGKFIFPGQKRNIYEYII